MIKIISSELAGEARHSPEMTLTVIENHAKFLPLMKCILPICAIATLSLAACNNGSSPITRGGYDPLLTAGSNNTPVPDTQITFTAGQFVRAAMDNTAFFKNRPNGTVDADKLLSRGTSMKVISNNDSYLKVELDSGEIGFVPTVMLEDPNAAPQGLTTNPGEYQIYPPLPGNGLDSTLPVTVPTTLPPEGAIPTAIDPDAPSPTAPPLKENLPKTVAPAEPTLVTPTASEQSNQIKEPALKTPGE